MDFKVRIDVLMQYQDWVYHLLFDVESKADGCKDTDYKHIMGCRLNNYEAADYREP